jgi:xanthine dehydrogenase accessory factor
MTKGLAVTTDPNETVESYCRNWDGAAPYARATIVRTEGATAAKAGAKAIVTAAGELIGWLGGGCLRGAVLRAAQSAIRSGEPKLIRVRPKEQVTGPADADGVELHASSCPSKGVSDIFIEPVTPKPVLIVIGTSFVAGALVQMAAPLGFGLLQVTPAPGNNTAIPLSELQQQPGLDRSFITIATQGSADYAALSAAMATAAPYVAFVASTAKSAAMRERLTKDGFDETSLVRLHAPAGLNIGSETPAEIAVAILAEIIGFRRAAAQGGAR